MQASQLCSSSETCSQGAPLPAARHNTSLTAVQSSQNCQQVSHCAAARHNTLASHPRMCSEENIKRAPHHAPVCEHASFAVVQCSRQTSNRTMPLRVQSEAEAMCGTTTTFSHSDSPGHMLGSSSNTSSPHLPPRHSPPFRGGRKGPVLQRWLNDGNPQRQGPAWSPASLSPVLRREPQEHMESQGGNLTPRLLPDSRHRSSNKEQECSSAACREPKAARREFSLACRKAWR
jgi:hypothetical protein